MSIIFSLQSASDFEIRTHSRLSVNSGIISSESPVAHGMPPLFRQTSPTVPEALLNIQVGLPLVWAKAYPLVNKHSY